MTEGTSSPAPDESDGTAGDDPRWRLTPTKIIVAVVLLVAIVVPLLVPTYARDEPRLIGFPFFYWYQLAWVFIAAALVGVSFLLLKREREAYERDRTDGAGGGRR
jgi:hypothetical protein